MVSASQVFASVEAALLFLVVSSPAMYQLTQRLFGGACRLVAKGGAPTVAGLILHAVVFGLLVYLLMIVQGRRDGFVDGAGDDHPKSEEGEKGEKARKHSKEEFSAGVMDAARTAWQRASATINK
jgi:hypothetical protein